MEPSIKNEEMHSNAMSYKEKSADKAPDMVQVANIWDASSVNKSLKTSTPTDGKVSWDS